MVRLLRHRQTKGSVSARLHLNRRATPRLHLIDLGKFLAIPSFLPVSSPLEVMGDIFSSSDVFQQLIESSRRAP